MNFRARLLSRSQELDVWLDIDCPSDQVSMEAPHGYVFAATGVHYRDIHNCPRGAWKADAMYQALLDDLAMGLDKCEIPDCEICAEAQAKGE